LCQNGHENGLTLHCQQKALRAFFFRPCSTAGSTNIGSVVTPKLVINLIDIDQRTAKSSQDLIERSVQAPLAKQVVNRSPFTKSFRKISLGCSGAKKTENTINDQSLIGWRPPGSGWLPKNIHDQLPLIVRQSVSPNQRKPSVTDEQKLPSVSTEIRQRGFSDRAQPFFEKNIHSLSKIGLTRHTLNRFPFQTASTATYF